MSADDRLRQLAYDSLREGAWAAAFTTLAEDEVVEFVIACLEEAEARAAA